MLLSYVFIFLPYWLVESLRLFNLRQLAIWKEGERFEWKPIVWQLLARCGECGRSRWIVARARPRSSYPFPLLLPPLNRLPPPFRRNWLSFLLWVVASVYVHTAAYPLPHSFRGIRHFRVRAVCPTPTITLDLFFRAADEKSWSKDR